MDFLGYRYYKLYRLSLLSLSLWPYGKSFLKQIHAIFCIFLLISSTVTQLLKLFTMEFDLELVLTNLSFAFPSVIYLVKYFAFYIQSQKIKELMEQVQNDWNALKDEQEVEIIKRYAKRGRKHLYIFAGLVYPGTIGFILSPLLPDILDVVAPLNESRTRSLPYLAEYFLDQQKHFYPLLLHINLTIIVGIVTIISTETLFFAYVYHICGMFEITSYRIEHALDESMSILSTLNRENTIRMKIIDAVESHQKAIVFFEYMSSTFALSYFILIILGVASLSINLFRLFQVAVIMSDEKENFLLFLIFVVGHFYYMFICNYMGQKIIDNSTGISRKTYDTQWYTAPVQIQKLLLFMMQKSMNSCKFVMGGIYSVSLENFTTLASMSLSYFTVIYSVQQ
ncbi:odorant receptor 13a-like [Formica exsecta]|uniref:odorant receptor 13a-like n=1 Tax=Formica exsecta TaxID=72781 RepID=UPI001144AFA7|nr:odorant receptor 13a-like [Formica exsecta]